MIVAPIAFCAPLSWFSLLKKGELTVEACENYQKQSWRNRCNILSAGGVESLLVPVLHDARTFRHPIREIRVDYSKNFLLRIQRAIDAAYRSSAYFDYYRDGFFARMNVQPATLWELDWSLAEFFASALSLPMPPVTGDFTGAVSDMSPKRDDPYYVRKEYFQVFSDRFPFSPNLSIMDLLFNEGPSAADFL